MTTHDHNENDHDDRRDDLHDDTSDSSSPATPEDSSSATAGDGGREGAGDGAEATDGSVRFGRSSAPEDGADPIPSDGEATSEDRPLDHEDRPLDHEDRPLDHEVSDDAPHLAHLLRQAGRSLRREFFGALDDAGIDPRDLRGYGRRNDDEVVDDGAWTDEDPTDRASDEELRNRMRELRDRVSAKIDDILTEEEIESVNATLTKLIDALGGDEESRRAFKERMRRFGRDRGFGPGRFGPHGSEPRAYPGDRDGEHRDHVSADDDDFDPRTAFGHGRGWSRRGGERDTDGRFGRRGDRESREGYGSRDGFGPRGRGRRGRWGFDPRSGFDPDPREFFAQWMRGSDSGARGREEAYERGFAAGFEQGRKSRD
ncbi:hypothetical protein [Brevibacterium casei]